MQFVTIPHPGVQNHRVPSAIPVERLALLVPVRTMELSHGTH
jgi:hypothetical protein